MEEDFKIRYSRLMAVDEIGREGMERLRRSRVLVVGCGALGSMAAMQLAGSGIGEIGIMDFDTIDISNLQRQFFYRDEDAGKSKAAMLLQRMMELNPHVKVEIVGGMLNGSNARQLVKGYDFVVEATDNPASMILLDKACEHAGVTCVFAGISGFRGQVLTVRSGDTRYRDIFPDTEEAGGILPCSLGGVAGPAAAMAASVEVSEVLLNLSTGNSPLSGKMLIFDLADARFNVVSV